MNGGGWQALPSRRRVCSKEWFPWHSGASSQYHNTRFQCISSHRFMNEWNNQERVQSCSRESGTSNSRSVARPRQALRFDVPPDGRSFAVVNNTTSLSSLVNQAIERRYVCFVSIVVVNKVSMARCDRHLGGRLGFIRRIRSGTNTTQLPCFLLKTGKIERHEAGVWV